MKRHDALAALSRDHHQALVIAQRLTRADAATSAAAAEASLAYWRTEGQRHFREERKLFGLIERTLPEAELARLLQLLG